MSVFLQDTKTHPDGLDKSISNNKIIWYIFTHLSSSNSKHFGAFLCCVANIFDCLTHCTKRLKVKLSFSLLVWELNVYYTGFTKHRKIIPGEMSNGCHTHTHTLTHYYKLKPDKLINNQILV